MTPEQMEALESARDLFRRGNAGRAKRMAMRVLTAAPDNPDVLSLLGSIEMQRKNYGDAILWFREAAKHGALPADIYASLGFCLKLTHQPEEALGAFQKALEADKDNFNALFGAAGIYLSLGKTRGGQDLLERSVEKKPPTLEPFRLLATLTPAVSDKAFLKKLKAFDAAGYDDENLAHLEFAFAAAEKSQGNIAGFEEHLKAANQHLFDPHLDWFTPNRAAFEASREVFTKPGLEQASPQALKKFTPVFIVGLPRSGSTLLEQILASHSAVHGADELSFIRDLFVEDMGLHYGQAYPQFFVTMPAEDKAALASAYQDRVLAISPEKPVIVDKMLGNAFFIGAIRMILPWAKVIHLKRHPYDTALSIYSSFFAPAVPYANELKDLARYFRLHCDFMDLWQDRCPGFVHTLKYEDLVDNPEKEAKAVLKFIGLKWEPECLAFHETQRSVRTLSANQVRSKLYSTSIGGWKKHKAMLAPFIQETGDLLEKYGYQG